MFRKPSILRNLLLAFLGFGLGMGAVFPVFAQFFVEWNPGMFGIFVISCLLAGLVIGVVNYMIMKVVLLRRLRRIADVNHAISENDISLNCTMESHDLIGELIASFNQMAENLRGMIRLIADNTEKLTGSPNELVLTVGETSRDQGHQRDATTLVATAMNEMAATVREVASNTQTAAEAASTAASEAQNGALTATHALGTIGNLNQGIQRAVSVIDKVRAENDSIRSVLDVIQGISEQTNLLALNAAIEAARAGEQGRGFAVVADEVRNLARRTQDSAREIQDMLSRLNDQVQAAVDVMGEANAKAAESEEKVEESAMALGEIAGAIKSIEQMNVQIATAAEQQSAVAEDINRNIIEINDAAERGVQSMHRAQESTGELNEVARQLREIVGRFKLS
jgi:methyl-accepting chemotaxis protein